MDALARALVPTLLHELANTTQLLTGLHALLGIPDAGDLLERREGDLARAGDEAHRLGWLLGVLGAASGHDLLLTRRERSGLEWMRELVSKAARKAGRPLGPGPAELPELAGAAQPDGWTLPWAFGCALWSLGADAAWSLEDRGEHLEVCGAPLTDELRAAVDAAASGPEIAASGQLLLPKTSLALP
ncbi:MAG: hypothetical protein O2799_08635 [Planctomycetota bacterium]|nr:hypothetical protein [Planctomycetota bacterium]